MSNAPYDLDELTQSSPLNSTANTPVATSTSADVNHAARNRLVIAVLLVSAFVLVLNETIMGVALPRLMRDLQITANSAQWLTTTYMLTMAVVIPITGFLLQRFHTRPVFVAAMSLFSVGTLMAALSTGFEMLLIARVVQASGTAIMMPLLTTTVMTLVPPASRGKVMGNVSIVLSVPPAIGPTISGVILNLLDWRWMFWLVLPVAVVALVLGARRIANVTIPRRMPIDVISVILSALAFGGLVYGLSSLGASGSSAGVVPAWSPIVVGVVALAVFILRQVSLQRVGRALLDLRTFLSRTFTASVVLLAITMVALFGTIIILPIYMQNVLGLNPLVTGLLLLPGGLVMGLLGPLVGRIYDRSGPTVLLVAGSIMISLAFWGMTLFSQTTPFLFVLAAHFALSIGLGLMFTPLFTTSLAFLKPHLYSHGSAVVGTVQQLAGAAGTALFISLMSSRAATLSASGASTLASTTGGIKTAFLCGAIVSLVAIVSAFFVRKRAAS